MAKSIYDADGPPEGMSEKDQRMWWLQKRLRDRNKGGQGQPGVTPVQPPSAGSGPTKVGGPTRVN